MASLISHAAVPLALRLALGSEAVPGRLALAAVLCSALPDVDAVGYWAGIPYGHPLGHRGFSHSIVCALLVAGAACTLGDRLGARARAVFAVIGLATVSHGVLDAMTNGGLGVAFFSPFSNRRYFLPWRPLEVSPIGVSAFLSRRGVRGLGSEAKWIWLPLGVLASFGLAFRMVRGGPDARIDKCGE
ncbi:MAG: hypothetical protein DMG07_27265 [Acidobacteria bacterium]|nr:MAG: hypothetical protein DMG07_27265 [Acidobacteriota bacterium]